MLISPKFRNAVTALGVLGVLFFGYQLNSVPDYEVSIDQQTLKPVCSEGQCTHLYNLIVGNSGSKAQRVSVKLFSSSYKGSALPVKAMRFGKFAHEAKVTEADEITTIDLSEIDPLRSVEFRFVFIKPHTDSGPSWSDILEGVYPSKGKVVKGSAQTTSFLRFLFAFFGA